jgi:hypothetical protein
LPAFALLAIFAALNRIRLNLARKKAGSFGRIQPRLAEAEGDQRLPPACPFAAA